jgi:hypothetical protein
VGSSAAVVVRGLRGLGGCGCCGGKEAAQVSGREFVAAWIAGFVVGLTPAWWWGNVYVAFAVLLGGVVLSVAVSTAVRR